MTIVTRSRTIAGAVGYCAALAPLSLVALAIVLFGQSRLAGGWLDRWQRTALGDPPTGQGTDPAVPRRPAAVAGYALVGVVLGVVALVPLGVLILFVARGVFYGVVDPGPYDTSWGGPTRAGAWLAHFAVGIPLALAALVALAGLAALHRRWGRLLAGGPAGWWVVPVTLVTCGAVAALVRAWLHQI
jgi:hypothetical protein